MEIGGLDGLDPGCDDADTARYLALWRCFVRVFDWYATADVVEVGCREEGVDDEKKLGVPSFNEDMQNVELKSSADSVHGGSWVDRVISWLRPRYGDGNNEKA